MGFFLYNKLMLVTINTDASLHRTLRYGAYAFWAVSNDFKITKSGSFKEKCFTTDDAEAKCIINALKVVLLAHTGIHKIIINSDSLNAIAILENNHNHNSRYSRLNAKERSKLYKIYQKVLQQSKNNVTIEFRHVKAHSGVDDARSYVNEWCDTEAKRNMWAKVNSLKN